jgi:16S rRNA (cytosine967-C5)-methyltransferase
VKDLNSGSLSNNSPREVAFFILNEYLRTKNPLKNIINNKFLIFKPSSRDKRFMSKIIKGTIRYLLKIDFCIDLFSSKPTERMDYSVLNILRMGVYQLAYMDRVPSYSVVNESVEIAKKNTSNPSSKFINALLRKISSIDSIKLFIDNKINELIKDNLKKISIKYSYPYWIVKYWTENYGSKKTEKICLALNKEPSFFIRINRLKNLKKDLIKKFSGIKGINLRTGKLTDEFINYAEKEKSLFEDVIVADSVQNIENTDFYKEGVITIQDLSSQIAVKYFVRPKKGEKILDLCSAPGGKTTYMAELMGNEGEIVSVDINSKKQKLLDANLKRLGINNVMTLIADVSKPDYLEMRSCNLKDYRPKDYIESFDKIFIDSPCSAFGTISKNPDVKYNKKLEDLHRLADNSYNILINCCKYLKTGGMIIFYTCTISHLENQRTIEKFLKKFGSKYKLEKLKNFNKIKPISTYNKANIDLGEKDYFETMPYYFNSEAGFICKLIKY